jgi:protein-S-isoprenylcysteine O-methyltransferase Ste14
MIITGIILIVLGLVVRRIAIKTLGKNFTAALVVPTEITTKGIYKYIRHPSYTGGLLMIAGLALISAKLAVIYLAVNVATARSVLEEQIICSSHLKDKYIEYAKKAGRFLPKIRRK